METPTKTPAKTRSKTARKRSAKPASKTAATGSVVSREYQQQHEPDDFAQRLRKHVVGDDGAVDIAKLKALAEANGAWRPRYSSLNRGMSVMCVSVRLRALVRSGAKIVWGANDHNDEALDQRSPVRWPPSPYLDRGARRHP
jgi:hypothetical protein